MKLDQETIVKHQFWFLLGSYFLVWLIAVLCLKFIAPDKIKQLAEAYKGAADGVKNAQGGAVNVATFVPPWDKEAKLFNDHKSIIWKDAWDYQSGMYDWPDEWIKRYDMTKVQAPLTADDRNDYRERLYLNQIANLRINAPRWLNPVELQGGFDQVFRPMTRADWREIPTREEVWLAQEDFWVKREVFVVIWDAMVRRALMDPIPIDDKKESLPQGVEARYRFGNQNWEITLLIRKNQDGYSVIGGDSTIKNINRDRHPQPLTSAKGEGIKFVVAQDSVRSGFEVRGEPVTWNETRNFAAENYPKPLEGIKWTKEWIEQHPIFVSQGFDQTNSPIRRLNAIELPKQDCRSFVWPLQPNQLLMQLEGTPADPTQGATATNPSAVPSPAGGMGDSTAQGSAGMGAMMRAQMQGGQNGPMGGLGPRGMQQTGNKTPNNDIERNRYLQPPGPDTKTLPSRHLPLAIQLIAEQAHMHDILLALANSRLRFQLTQVEFRHVRDYTPQTTGDKKEGSSSDTPDSQYFMGGMATPMGGGGGASRSVQQQMAQQMRQQMQSRMQQGGAMDPRAMQGQQMQQFRQQMQQQMGGPGGAMGGGAMGGGAGKMLMMQPPGATGGAMKPNLALAPGVRVPSGRLTTTVGGTTKQAEEPQYDDDLVELTIYGIATLYRAPEAPATEPGQQAPAPAAPPSGSPTPAPAPSANGATQSPATTQPNSSTPPATTPPSDSKTPPSDAKTPAPKQPDTPVKEQPAPKPPAPPAGGKE